MGSMEGQVALVTGGARDCGEVYGINGGLYM
jgi:hypothetical protein